MKRKFYFAASVSFLALALVLCAALLRPTEDETASTGGVFKQTHALASAGDLLRTNVSAIFTAPNPAQPQEDALLSAYAADDAAAASLPATATSLPHSATAVKAVGRVARKDVRLRAETDPDAAILLFLQENAYVTVLEETEGWYRVNYDGSVGYVVADYIELLERSAEFTTYGTVNTDKLALRAAATVTGDTLTTLRKNTSLTVNGFLNGWLRVEYGGKTGYVMGENIDPTTVKPVAKKVTSGTGSSSTSSGKPVEVSGSGADVASLALEYEGVPYVYGGASEKGFDCSGFTMFVYDKFGCSLPHGATSQLNYGSYVDKASLAAGDLVFFQGTSGDNAIASHVGIYIGNNQFIHASSSSGRTVKVSSLGESYYASHYLTARRLCS